MENRIMETAKGIFSAKNLKRAGVVAALGAVLAGGGAYWHHGQEVAAKERVSEARTQMVRTQAEKEGLALLSEDAVRTLVADAIGVDETAITYRKIELTENRAKGMKHDDDKHKGAHVTGIIEIRRTSTRERIIAAISRRLYMTGRCRRRTLPRRSRCRLLWRLMHSSRLSLHRMLRFLLLFPARRPLLLRRTAHCSSPCIA